MGVQHLVDGRPEVLRALVGATDTDDPRALGAALGGPEAGGVDPVPDQQAPVAVLFLDPYLAIGTISASESGLPVPEPRNTGLEVVDVLGDADRRPGHRGRSHQWSVQTIGLPAFRTACSSSGTW
jgi:hypothetical protein